MAERTWLSVRSGQESVVRISAQKRMEDITLALCITSDMLHA